MGGWGEERGLGNIGTTGQVEDAHAALNEAGVDSGPLAMRAWKAALVLQAHKKEMTAKALRRVDL